MSNKASKKKISVNSLNYALKEIILPRWKKLSICLVIIIFTRLASLILPGSTKFLIDNIFIPKDLTQLPLMLTVVVIAVLVQAVGGFALVRILSVEAQYLITQLRVKVQQHILNLPISFFQREKSGSIVSRIMDDVEGVRNLVGTGFIQLLGGLIAGFFSLFILIRINATLTLISLALLTVFGLIMFQSFKRIRPIFRKRGAINAEVSGRLTETIGGIKVVKSFAVEEKEIGVFRKGVDRLFQNVKKTLTLTAMVTMITIFLTGIISAIVMGSSSYSVVNGEMTTGDFVAFLLYLGFLTFPIVQISNIGSQFTESFAGLDRMEEVLSLPTEKMLKQENKPFKEKIEKVVFDQVSFSYQSNQDRQDEGFLPVIKGISFTIEKGQTIALVGSSGSGKSTISSLLSSLITPQKGEILVNGNVLSKLNFSDYRKQLAIVLQDDFLFDGTIRENILFAAPKSSNKALAEAIKLSYVDEFVKKFPNGLDTVIGERGVKLSGGQKQRLSIARVLLANPSLLILDEATSSLDNESENYIQKSLNHILKNRLTLVIAHRLSTIRKADRILVIEKGKIVETGNHNSLIRKKGRYYELYTYQSRI